MSGSTGHVPPRQARSRESLRRMLDAAEVVIARHGVSGATLPRIAAQARISPASVYRRFRDKDALIRAVFERIAERSSQAMAAQLDPESVRPMGIARFARQVISSMIEGYRRNAGLSRAAVLYAQEHRQVEFVRATREREEQSFRMLVETFLIWRDDIGRKDAEEAIRFGFLMTAFALRELILFDRTEQFRSVARVDDDWLRQELPRAFLAYLGVADGSGRRRRTVASSSPSRNRSSGR